MSHIAKLLPKLLRNEIKLSKVERIELIHAKNPFYFASAYAFMKNFIPPMRYYNEKFVFSRSIKPKTRATFIIYDKENNKLGEIETRTLNADQILEKIISMDK